MTHKKTVAGGGRIPGRKMKLYDRDYTQLTADERAEWHLIYQNSLRKFGDLTVVTGRPNRDYPKAIRHFNHLFPNNYLDVVELKDEPRLHTLLESFRQLIDSKAVIEREILSFIASNEAYFIIASILKSYFNFGHHEAHLFREFQLGNSYKVDYILIGKGSGGWQFVFVELEAIVGKIVLANGELGEVFRKGLAQLANWDAWLEANYGSLSETFDKHKHVDKALPDEFRQLDKSRIHYVVIAGRRSDFKKKTYQIQRKTQKDSSELILHYDNLLHSAENIIGKNTY